MKKFKLNTSLLTDAAIAGLTVKNAPRVLGMILPGNFTTGFTGQLTAGALTYLLGVMLKKPAVGTIGLAMVGVNLIQSVAVDPVLGMVGAPAAAGAALGARTARPLGAYTSTPRSAKNYAMFYN